MLIHGANIGVDVATRPWRGASFGMNGAPNPAGKLLYATKGNRASLSRQAKAGRITQVGRGIYLSGASLPVPDAIGKHRFELAARYWPEAVICDRSAFTGGGPGASGPRLSRCRPSSTSHQVPTDRSGHSCRGTGHWRRTSSPHRGSPNAPDGRGTSWPVQPGRRGTGGRHSRAAPAGATPVASGADRIRVLSRKPRHECSVDISCCVDRRRAAQTQRVRLRGWRHSRRRCTRCPRGETSTSNRLRCAGLGRVYSRRRATPSRAARSPSHTRCCRARAASSSTCAACSACLQDSTP